MVSYYSGKHQKNISINLNTKTKIEDHALFIINFINMRIFVVKLLVKHG